MKYDPYDPYESDPVRYGKPFRKNYTPYEDREEEENAIPRDEDDEGDFGCYSSEDSLRKTKREIKKREEEDLKETKNEDLGFERTLEDSFPPFFMPD